MKWLDDVFFAVAFAICVAVVAFSVYDGSEAYPSTSTDGLVVSNESNGPPEVESEPKIVATLAEKRR